jgi:hypothetical protein
MQIHFTCIVLERIIIYFNRKFLRKLSIPIDQRKVEISTVYNIISLKTGPNELWRKVIVHLLFTNKVTQVCSINLVKNSKHVYDHLLLNGYAAYFVYLGLILNRDQNRF